MAQLDKAPEGGKFRAVAAAALDGTAGAWGDGDLLCVKVTSAGLVEADHDDCDGVILTTEGKRDLSLGQANHKQVVGGNAYTVIFQGEFTEMEQGGWGGTPTAFAEGDLVYADGTGTGDAKVTTPTAGAVFLGWIVKGDPPGAGGARLVVNVNGRPVA